MVHFFLASFIAVFCSLFSPNIGSIFYGLVGIGFLLNRDRPSLERSLSFLIFTIPVSMIPIFEGIPPIFSWTTVGLLFLAVLLLRHRYPVTILRAYIFLLYILASTITISFSSGGLFELYYTAQILIFFLPALFVLQSKDEFKNLLRRESGEVILNQLSTVIMVLNLSVIFQWQIYTRTGAKIGEISFFGSRITFDSLVPAYSVLSSILAIGLPLGPILWNRGRKTLGFLMPSISVLAIIVNSSRTGLVAGFLGLLLLLVFSPSAKIKFSTKISILAFFSTAVVVNAGLSFLSSFRGGNFFEDNGRFDTFEDGLRLSANSLPRFLFGVGYADYPTTPPHNFFVESLVCSGLVATVIFAVWLFSIFTPLIRSEWLYLPLTCFIGGQLFSGFYNVKAFTIILILAFALSALDRENLSALDRENIANCTDLNSRDLASATYSKPRRGKVHS